MFHTVIGALRKEEEGSSIRKRGVRARSKEDLERDQPLRNLSHEVAKKIHIFTGNLVHPGVATVRVIHVRMNNFVIKGERAFYGL